MPALAAALLCVASANAGGWNPQGWEVPAKAETDGPTHPAALLPATLLTVYRELISPIDGAKCPSFPTCSTYAVAAVKKHGPLGGAALAAARLVSEADEAAFSRWVYIDGVPKVWYPVEETVILERSR